MDELIERVRVAGPVDYGSLAPLVFGSAAAGDMVSQDLKAQAVEALAGLLEAMDQSYPPGWVAFSTVGSIAERLGDSLLEHAPRLTSGGLSSTPGKP